MKTLVEVCHADVNVKDNMGRGLLHAIAMGHADWVTMGTHGHFRSKLAAESHWSDPQYARLLAYVMSIAGWGGHRRYLEVDHDNCSPRDLAEAMFHAARAHYVEIDD